MENNNVNSLTGHPDERAISGTEVPNLENFTENQSNSEEGPIITESLGYRLVDVDERFKTVEEIGNSSMPINDLLKDVQSQPEKKHNFRGINNGGVGAIFGPSKGGKTTFAECLLMMLCAGRTQFLGQSLYIPYKRVLFVSMEEYYVNRTKRNGRQIEYINQTYKPDDNWEQNYVVIKEDFPKYLATEKDWEKLEAIIEAVGPAILVLDSLGRLLTESIEKSSSAIKLMKRLRGLSDKYGITIILIHHTTKLKDKPLTMSDMAGSRVISQELDFMIGVNRLSNGTRYIKDIAYRYFPDDNEKVLAFEINEHSFIEARGYFTEQELIDGVQPPKLNPSDEIVIEFIKEYMAANPASVIKHSLLVKHLVDTKHMSIPTLHASLNRLEEAEIIKKIKRGQYVMMPK